MTADSERDAQVLSRRAFLRGAAPATEAGAVRIGAHCFAFNGVACRSCEDACGTGALRFRPRLGGSYHPAVDVNNCTACGDCLPLCPVNALSLEGEERV